ALWVTVCKGGTQEGEALQEEIYRARERFNLRPGPRWPEVEALIREGGTQTGQRWRQFEAIITEGGAEFHFATYASNGEIQIRACLPAESWRLLPALARRLREAGFEPVLSAYPSSGHHMRLEDVLARLSSPAPERRRSASVAAARSLARLCSR